MTNGSGRVPSEPGSRESSPDGPGLSGFDPSRAVSVLAEAIHDRLFGVSNLGDPALALAEISDGGGIHEAAHALLRALPPRQSGKVTLCSFCGTPNSEVPWMLTSEIGVAAICTECLVTGCVLIAGLRDSDGSPKGGDACGSVEDDSAGRQASPNPRVDHA